MQLLLSERRGPTYRLAAISLVNIKYSIIFLNFEFVQLKYANMWKSLQEVKHTFAVWKYDSVHWSWETVFLNGHFKGAKSYKINFALRSEDQL